MTDVGTSEANSSSSQRKRRRLPSVPSTAPRNTQRAPQSCYECSRRKIKCDKTIPCRQCIDRGDDHLCRREEVTVKGTLIIDEPGPTKTFDHLVAQIQDLQLRLEIVEQRQRTQYARPSSIRAESPIHFEPLRLPGAMEEAALGIGETSRWDLAERKLSQPQGSPSVVLLGNPSSDDWYTPRSLGDCLSALPIKTLCSTLVAFYCDEVAWLFAAVHVPTFLNELEEFWVTVQHNAISDDKWLSLLFAVLSISAFFMDDAQATRSGMPLESLRDMGKVWFNASIATLFRCGGWTEPSLVICQTLQTLGPAFHLTGNTALHRALTPILHSHVKVLNLHLLGRRNQEKEEIDVELGRRVWWNVAEGDWIFLPYHRYCSILPQHFTTAMPSMPETTIPTGERSTSLLYRISCYRAARVLFDLFGVLASTEEPSHESVIFASESLERIRNLLPTAMQISHFQGNQTMSSSNTERSMLGMTLAYRTYQCNRMYFIRALSDDRYSSSYTACIQAAKDITMIAGWGLPATFYQLWNTTVMMVAAGIVLSLDFLHRPPTPAAEVGLPPQLSNLVTQLQNLDDQSGIASRGAALIGHIVQLGAQRNAAPGSSGQVTITKEAILDLVRPKVDSNNHHMVSPNNRPMQRDWVTATQDFHNASGAASHVRASQGGYFTGAGVSPVVPMPMMPNTMGMPNPNGQMVNSLSDLLTSTDALVWSALGEPSMAYSHPDFDLGTMLDEIMPNIG